MGKIVLKKWPLLFSKVLPDYQWHFALGRLCCLGLNLNMKGVHSSTAGWVHVESCLT